MPRKGCAGALSPRAMVPFYEFFCECMLVTRTVRSKIGISAFNSPSPHEDLARECLTPLALMLICAVLSPMRSSFAKHSCLKSTRGLVGLSVVHQNPHEG